VVGVAGAAGLVDGAVDVEGDLVGEAEAGDLGGGFEGAAAGGDGRGGDDLDGWAGAGDAVGEGELGVLFDAERAGGEGVFGEAALEDLVGVFVLLPEVGDGGFALGEGEEEVVEAVALEEGADDEGRGGLWEDVGEEALGLVPSGAGEVAERGAGGDEDGVEGVGLHELAGEVEAGLALVLGDGDDVFSAVCEGEDRGRESFGWCFLRGAFLGLEGESWGRGGGGEEEAAAGQHRVNCRACGLLETCSEAGIRGLGLGVWGRQALEVPRSPRKMPRDEWATRHSWVTRLSGDGSLSQA